MFDYSYLTKLGVVQKYHADEVFFHEGDPGSEMYIVLQGRVAVLSKSIDGSLVKVAEIGPGGFFGEMSLLEKLPRSASILALEDTIVISLDNNNSNNIISHNPEFAFRIMKGLSSRVRRMTEDLVNDHKQALAADKYLDDNQENPASASLETEGEKAFSGVIEVEAGSKKAPESHEQYLFDKEITCPICGQRFTTKMIRNSKLRLKGVQSDLRQCYEGFEILWYLIWVCPSCCYANFHYQFKQTTEELQDKILRDQLAGENSKLQKLKVVYSAPRTFDEVLRAYELLHENFGLVRTSPENYAKLWLQLAWLYLDADNPEMYEKASVKALEYYQDVYFNSRSTSVEQDARLALILGDLNFRLKKYDDSYKYYRKAIVPRSGNPIVNRQAEDRIVELKKLMKGAN